MFEGLSNFINQRLLVVEEAPLSDRLSNWEVHIISSEVM